jgi:hypothetical protein
MIDRWTVSRKVASGPPRFLVWLTRAGATAVFEVQARNAQEAQRRAAAEFARDEALFNTI